jgi:hypothetical protein
MIPNLLSLSHFFVTAAFVHYSDHPGLALWQLGMLVTSLQSWCVVHIVLGLWYFEVTFAAVALATAWMLVDYFIHVCVLLGASNSVSTP